MDPDAEPDDAGFPDAFEVGDDGETLDLDEVLTGRGFITGKSGAGKSNTASVVVEELLKLDLSLLVVDVDGEYVGLKESFEVLHAGADPSCDVQVSPKHAEQLVDVALAQNVPVILDISGFLDPEDGQALVHAVCRELFHEEATRRKPFLLVVEEIHEFVPQQGSGGDLGKLLIQIVKRGRKRGLGICGLSQRPAAVDKEFITQCDWLVWHRLTWESDIEVVRRFLSREYADQVENLDDGEAFVVTDWNDQVRRIQFRRKETFDAGATPSLDDVSRPNFETRTVEIAAQFDDGSDDSDSAPTDTEADAAETESDGSKTASASTSGKRRSSGRASSRQRRQTKNDSLLDESIELAAYVVRRTVQRTRNGVRALWKKARN